VLAERIDARADTGSALAALVREHRATLAEALAKSDEGPSIVDQLAARRRERLARLGIEQTPIGRRRAIPPADL
jgi:hypothetical protein